MPLTVKQIEAASFGTSKERLGDGSGLYLRLYPSGKKSFQVQVPKDASKHRVWVSLGDFPNLSLKGARDTVGWVRLQVARGWRAEQIRQSLKAGKTDVFGEAPAPQVCLKSNTPFTEVAAVWFDRKRLGLKNGKHIDQNWNTIATYAFPKLGTRPIGAITRQEIVETLRPIWREKHETARRTFGRIQEIFELAKLEYDVAFSPAEFDPKVAYGRVQRTTEHFGSLQWERVPELWDWLVSVSCEELTRQFVMMILFSAKRTGEVRFSRVSYFTTKWVPMWITPAEEMKMKREHVVPLSSQAIAVFDNACLLSGTDGFLFAKPWTKSGVVSENVALNLLKRFDPRITGHGLRATFKGWARAQRRYEPDAIEFALAHKLPPIEAAYFRGDHFEERKPLMQDWADFVTSRRQVPSLREKI